MRYRELQRAVMDHELHEWPSPVPLPPNGPMVGSGEDDTLESGSVSIEALFEIGVILSYHQN